MFDREGCGKDSSQSGQLEEIASSALLRNGWGDRAAAIVLDPELEKWVFSDSPEVDAALGWKGKNPSLRKWLESKEYLVPGQLKPARPKDAMEAALRHVRMPRSSSIYGRLAECVSIGRCTDGAFQKLKLTLQTWFPIADKKTLPALMRLLTRLANDSALG